MVGRQATWKEMALRVGKIDRIEEGVGKERSCGKEGEEPYIGHFQVLVGL